MAISSREKFSAVREFTDRVESRKAFWDRLEQMIAERGTLSVNYYGAGGVGKTGLIKKICVEARSADGRGQKSMDVRNRRRLRHQSKTPRGG